MARVQSFQGTHSLTPALDCIWTRESTIGARLQHRPMLLGSGKAVPDSSAPGAAGSARHNNLRARAHGSVGSMRECHGAQKGPLTSGQIVTHACKIEGSEHARSTSFIESIMRICRHSMEVRVRSRSVITAEKVSSRQSVPAGSTKASGSRQEIWHVLGELLGGFKAVRPLHYESHCVIWPLPEIWRFLGAAASCGTCSTLLRRTARRFDVGRAS